VVSGSLGIILDVAKTLSWAAAPETSGFYQSMQEAAGYAWQAGEWAYYGTVVEQHGDLIDSFKDLYLTTAFYLADGQLKKVKEIFPDTANMSAYYYNYYFGDMTKEGAKTIERAYNKFGLDYRKIDSSVHDHYLSGTSKGFFTRLP
jgi:hypothetical protein